MTIVRKAFIPQTRIVLLGCILCVMLVAVLQPLFASDAVRLALSVVFGILVLGLVAAGLVSLAMRWLGSLGFSRAQLLSVLGIVIGAAVAGLVFIHFHFAQEQDIKVYDAIVYWTRVIEGRTLLQVNIPAYLQALRQSFSDVYNNLAAFALIPVSYLTGLSFAGYCQSVFLVYYLPACVFLSIFTLRLFAMLGDQKPGVLSFGITLFLFTFSVSLAWPLLEGYLDIVGVLFMALMLGVSLSWDATQFNWKKDVLLIVFSVLLLLMRRWYAYYIVGFYAMLGVAAALDMLVHRRITLRRVGGLFANLGMIAAASAALIMLINTQILGLFFEDYAEAYSAYKNLTFAQNMLEMAQNTRWPLIILSAAGLLIGICYRRIRLTTLRLLGAALIAAILFRRVQDLNPHQLYLLLPTVLIFACLAVLFIAHRLYRGVSVPIVAAILAICFVNTSAAFVPWVGEMLQSHTAYRVTLKSYPKHNANLPLFQQISKDLEDRLYQTSNKVYVVGSGTLLSPELLRRCRLPEVIDSAPYLLEPSTEDLREGFPSQFFMADYILISDPISISHGYPHILYQLHDMLMNDASMKDYYAIEARYPAEGGEILLIKKLRPADTGSVGNLCVRMRTHYPDHPFACEPDLFLALSMPETGYWYDPWAHELHLYKWYGAPMEINWCSLQGLTQMSFALSCQTPGLELVLETPQGILYQAPVSTDGPTHHTVHLRDSQQLTLYVREIDPEAQLDATITFSQTGLR